MKKLTVFIGCIILSFGVYSQDNVGCKNYPKPILSYNQLFYLQHSLNHNTVVFEAKFDEDGVLCKTEPVIAYWIMYEKGGAKENLTQIEKKLAFGINARELNNSNYNFEIKLNSYKDKSIYLRQISPFKAEAYMKIGDEIAKLDHVFIQTHYSGFMLHIDSIELFGQNANKDLKKYACIDVSKR